MEQDLVEWLLAGTAVTAICSTRINWFERPQAEALPAVTLSIVSGSPTYLSSGAPTALRKYVVQADCWAATKLAAVQLRQAVEARVEAINLNDDAAPLEGGFVRDPRAGEPEQLGGGGRVFRQSFDFAVWRRG